MEDTLRLHEHRSGTLTDLDRFLHNHTGGMIGSLSHAIRGAALDAILTSEKITKKSLQAIPLDHTAHTTASMATKTAASR